MSEKLYNGIIISDQCPLQDVNLERDQPQKIPYLDNPPEVITIDVGRQLFVDEFIIDAGLTNMARTYHKPAKYSNNPIMFPETAEEKNPNFPPVAISKCGGVWFDDKDQLFKMWYMAGYLGHMAYAYSTDGVHWKRPQLDVVPGTNLCLPRKFHPDSGSVVIDYDTKDPSQRYKMLLRAPDTPDHSHFPGLMMTSADGIHWSAPKKTGDMGDRSTMFYNTFRKKWVQSIRYSDSVSRRSRHYFEHDNYLKSGEWNAEDTIPWLRADCLDESGESFPELYNFDSIPYESLMLGFFQILKGPPNHICDAHGMPKLTELVLGYSRDGFHYSRPDRQSFIGARREPGSWEYGYIESSAGMCLVVGDELWFYYSAYAGDPKRINCDWTQAGTYANGAVGLAKLRRDGFVSMSARFESAHLHTRPVLFSGSHFFVNVNTAGSELKVVVVGPDNKSMKGFDIDDCIGYSGNSTCTEIRWKDADLASLAGQPVRFLFIMDRGEIYSFWVSQSSKGESRGFVAAGGPGYNNYKDQ